MIGTGASTERKRTTFEGTDRRARKGPFLARIHRQALLATIPVLLIVAVLVFLMLRLTPGDPAAILAGDAASSEQIAAIRASLGLDRSLPVQFAIWLGNLLQGELGQSYFYKMQVTQLIGQRLEPRRWRSPRSRF